MYRELIRHTISLNMTHQNYKSYLDKKQKLKISKIDFQDYELYRTSYNFHFNKIKNILGDGERNAISYYNLTNDKILKKHSLSLEKEQEKREFLNQLNDERDWSSHFNISDGRSKINDLNTINNNQIDITIPEYADILLALDLFEDNQNFLDDIELIKFHIERDFHLIFDELIKFNVYFDGITTKSDLEYSLKSFKYSKDSKFKKW